MNSIKLNLTILIITILNFKWSDSKVLPIHRIDTFRGVNVRGFAQRRPARVYGRMGGMAEAVGYPGGMGGYGGPQRPGGPEGPGSYGAPEGPDGPDIADGPDEGGYGGGYDQASKVKVYVKVYTGRRAEMVTDDNDVEP